MDVASTINLSIQTLASEKCIPCSVVDRLPDQRIVELLKEFPGWELIGRSIEKEFRFKSYKQGLTFAYAVGIIAEEQDHHPDILVRWRRVKLTLSTHSASGLTQNDFIIAARSEMEYQHKFSVRI